MSFEENGRTGERDRRSGCYASIHGHFGGDGSNSEGGGAPSPDG